jgi:hypothetical protein
LYVLICLLICKYIALVKLAKMIVSMDRQAAILTKTPVQTMPAQKMGRAAGCTARPKRTEAGRKTFSVRGPIQTDRFRQISCLKWVGPLEMSLLSRDVWSSRGSISRRTVNREKIKYLKRSPSPSRFQDVGPLLRDLTRHIFWLCTPYTTQNPRPALSLAGGTGVGPQWKRPNNRGTVPRVSRGGRWQKIS